MEERLVTERNRGLNTTGLRTWGMVFLLLAAAGKALLQNRLLDMNGTTDLLTALNAEGGMAIATVALILQAIEGCAIPIFAFLTVEGAVHTADFSRYLVRVFGLAALTELPYNYAMSGSLLDMSDRNPVFSVALVLVLIYFYRRYGDKNFRNTAVKVAVTVAAVAWAFMLNLNHGPALVVVAVVLWLMRGKPNLRNLAAAAAMMVCCLISPFYLMAPMGCMVLQFYNGEKGPSRREIHYLVYPVALVAIAVIGTFL